MFLILLSTILVVLVFRKLLLGHTFWEILATGILMQTALMGILPFLLHEYLRISYHAGMLFIALFNGLLLLGVQFWMSRIKAIKILETKTFYPSTLWFLGAVFLLLFIKSMYLPIQGWDAFSMYDGRAQMMLENITYDQLVELSRYDVYNTNYYLSYPPMTSSIHTLIYIAGFNSPMFIYTFFYMILALSILAMLKELNVGLRLQYVGLGMLVFHPMLLSQTSVAYTNLPMIAFQSMSLLFTLYYIKNPQNIYLFLSGFFLSCGNWTRNEPTSVSFILLMAVILFSFHARKFSLKKKIVLLITYTCLSISLRMVWYLYLHQFVTLIPIEELDLTLTEMLVRLFESVFLVNLLSVSIFIYSSIRQIWLFLFLAASSAAFYIFSPKIRKNTPKEEIGLLLLIFFNFLIIVSGTMYFSRVYSWWNLIGGSLLRSSLVFIPLCITYGLTSVQHRLDKKL